MFIDKLKRLVNPALADSLLVHSAAEGTGVIPIDDFTKLLNAGNLKMPDSDETIADHYRSFSNRNLLDNWYFPTAVNQRGKDTYSAKGETAIYSIDRFLVGRANLSVNEDGISFAWDGVTENNGYLQQRVPFPNLGGNTFTFSVLTADNHLISRVIEVGTKIGTNYGEFVFEHHIMLVIGNSNNNYAWCAIYSDTTTPTTLKAAKLELGRNQTLAHREGNKWVLNDPPPNYALELLKCQRYQVVYDFKYQWCTVMATGIISPSVAGSRPIITLPVEPRITNPSVSILGNGELKLSSASEEKRYAIKNVLWGQAIGNSLRMGVELESCPESNKAMDKIINETTENMKLIVDANL